MKTLSLTIMFMLTYFLTSAQTNYPLIKENKVWSEVNCLNFGGCETHFYKFQGDTTVGTNLYKKLYISADSSHSSWSLFGAMREELNQKVYFTDLIDEYLFYDFTLTPGEIYYANIRGCQFEMTLDSIDSIELLNGETRKRYNFSNWNTEQWIEGIGSLKGLLNIGFNMCMSDVYIDLNCFTENDTLKFQNSNFSSCYYTTVGLAKDIPIENFAISPNPLTTYGILKSTSFLTDCELKIYNTAGKLVRDIPNLSGQEFVIERKDLNSGLYFIQLTKDNNIIGICKMIISDK